MATSEIVSFAPVPLRIGGLVPLSTIDYPGQLSAVVFTRGCNLRCQYCHNPDMLQPQGQSDDISWQEVLRFLERRQGLLDAVVFSGGEPLLQRGLGSAMAEVRRLGFRVGLHTAGQLPERLFSLLGMLDWVGLDIKGLSADYPHITGTRTGSKCWQSLDILLASEIDYEVRTTVHWGLLPPARFSALVSELQGRGVRHFAVQNCRIKNCLNPALKPSLLAPEQEAELFKQAETAFEQFVVR